jgi:hypothetical protein
VSGDEEAYDGEFRLFILVLHYLFWWRVEEVEGGCSRKTWENAIKVGLMFC